MTELIEVLRASVQKRGEIPLTNAHLLNILLMAERLKEHRAEALENSLSEMMADERMWGHD